MGFLEFVIVLLAAICLIFGVIKLVARDWVVGLILVVVGLLLAGYPSGFYGF